MSRQLSSISRFGTTEEFYLQVARSQIAGHKSIYKFGFNGDIDDSAGADISISAGIDILYIQNTSL